MRVHWTDTAVEHLLSIYEYIAQDSPVYAQRMIDRLTRRSEQIATFLLSRRMVPEYEADDIREMIEKPYRIIYRIKPDQVDILAAVHSAQMLSSKL
ncbi:TPA: type II toxin-antitoxin system RelE/ParE family toxin [Candidatus Acetothermia bacterium]|nr:type II toxin-antitoxin system RelE/ParE family toxin [Candidatus Acetothermia bacterium]